MAYERNTLEGIRSWLDTEVSSPGWNASSIAKGLTEDVMTIIGDHVNEFDSRTKQGLLLSILNMRKNDIMFLNNDIKKIIESALNDSNEFVDMVAHILQPYPVNQQLNIKIDTWSDGFNTLLQDLGNKISTNGFKFHTHEDMLLQINARIAPAHASSDYMDFKPTHVHHFTLTTDTDDIVLAEHRHARFKELVESEERSEQAEAQAAQVAAKKRAGADLSGPPKRAMVSSPTTERPNPFPPHRGSIPSNPGGGVRPPPPRSMSVGSAQSSSLFNKRAARPAPGGGLFVTKPRPPHASRPIQRSTSGSASLPRGLQRVQKTQMLDFNAATEMEQNNANAIKEAQDHIQAQKEAKKQEALDKKKRLADEKRERDEARRAAKEAADREKALAREAAKAAKEAEQAAKAAAAAAAAAASSSSSSIPTSPKTPTLPTLPIKYEQQDKPADDNFTTTF